MPNREGQLPPRPVPAQIADQRVRANLGLEVYVEPVDIDCVPICLHIVVVVERLALPSLDLLLLDRAHLLLDRHLAVLFRLDLVRRNELRLSRECRVEWGGKDNRGRGFAFAFDGMSRGRNRSRNGRGSDFTRSTEFDPADKRVLVALPSVVLSAQRRLPICRAERVMITGWVGS